MKLIILAAGDAFELDGYSKLLINGFANEIINCVNIPEFKKELEKLFLESLPKYKLEF